MLWSAARRHVASELRLFFHPRYTPCVSLPLSSHNYMMLETEIKFEQFVIVSTLSLRVSHRGEEASVTKRSL